jgi:hypothetical protein
VGTIVVALGVGLLVIAAVAGVPEAIRAAREGRTSVRTLAVAVAPVVLILGGLGAFVWLATLPMAGRRPTFEALQDLTAILAAVIGIVAAGALAGLAISRPFRHRGSMSIARAARLGGVLAVGYLYVLARLGAVLGS